VLSLCNIAFDNVCFGRTHCLLLPGECECEGSKHFWIICTRIHGFISRSTPLYTSELVTSSHSLRWPRREAESLNWNWWQRLEDFECFIAGFLQIFTVWNCVILNYFYLLTNPPYLLTYLLTYLLNYLLTNVLTPWNRVLLEKLTVSQIVKKFPPFNGTRKDITAFTGAHHLSLSSLRSIQSISHHSISRFAFYSTLPSTPGTWKWSLSLKPEYTSSFPYVLHAPPISFFPILSPGYY